MSYVCMLLLIIFSTTASSLHSGRNPTNAPNPCEGLPNDTFVTNPKGCKYMFHCRNGQPFEAFCPGDMWFNPDSGICDYRSNVDCHLDDTKPIRNPEEFIFCPLKDSKVPTFRASSIDCARYYLCYHGKPVHQQCAGDLQWNKVTEQCDVANKVNCVIASNMPQCPKTGQVFFPHTTECNYFVFCHHGFATIQQCPFYHHWDASAGMCKWRTLARCGIRKPTK